MRREGVLFGKTCGEALTRYAVACKACTCIVYLHRENWSSDSRELLVLCKRSFSSRLGTNVDELHDMSSILFSIMSCALIRAYSSPLVVINRDSHASLKSRKQVEQRLR